MAIVGIAGLAVGIAGFLVTVAWCAWIVVTWFIRQFRGIHEKLNKHDKADRKLKKQVRKLRREVREMKAAA